MKPLPLILGTFVGVAAIVGGLLATRSVTVKGGKPADTGEVGEFSLPPVISFNEHIQPILSANCYHCHGPDAGTRKAGLRFDREASVFAPAASGEPAIRKNKPEESQMLRRILSTNPAEVMPPPDAHTQLKPIEKAMIARWIREGAVYQPHWAFIPPVRPAPPQEAADQWSRTPIDRFILEKLRAQKLAPSGPEDPRTLIRRVSLDLTGLLPEPADADAFAKNPTDAAYEAYVDRLLASPHYGEHRARYWLDYVRYADSHGLHFDNSRAIWPYRDYVVRSFNANKPFDQFIREQLAGDLLPHRTVDSLVATGYVRSNVSSNEGGTIREELATNVARDRAEAFGTAFLGLTVGCAACHDHKLDPTSQRDFYRLTAFFNNTADSAWDMNKAAYAPFVKVPDDKSRPAADAALLRYANVLSKLQTVRREAPSRFAAALAAGQGPKAVSAEGLELRLRLDEGKGDVVKNSAPSARPAQFSANTNPLIWGEESWLWPSMRMDIQSRLPLGQLGTVEGNQPFSAGGWVRLRVSAANSNTGSGALLSKMAGKAQSYRGWDLWQSGGQFTVELINHAPDKLLKVRTKAAFPRDEWRHVFFTYDGSSTAKGVRIFVDGRPVETVTEKDTLTPDLTIKTDAPMQVGRRTEENPMLETRYQDVRFYRRALTPEEAGRLPFEDLAAEIVAHQPDPAKWTADERFVVLDRYFLGGPDTAAVTLAGELGKIDGELAAITKNGSLTLVAQERPQPAYANILARGVYRNRLERVDPGVPAFLPPLPKGVAANRLALANWVVSDKNPLTARVTVNRMWQEIFGRGLVETSEDFGVMGSRPSHPQLLDWLAVEFRESGWNEKAFYRQLVLSSAYRQSSHVTPEALEKDPDNRYFARAPRFRMDGEMIRDAALQTAGLLAGKLGGPPVKSYQPEGIWEAVSMPDSDLFHYKMDHGDALYRRSLYSFWRRFSPPPSLETFDAPAREVVCTRRARTDTPLQALVTMNDPQFVEAARKLAERAIRAAPEPAARLDALAEWTLARPLADPERKILLASSEKFRAHFSARPEDAKSLLGVGEIPADPALKPGEVAEWTMVASQFYNLDEFLNK